MISARAYSCLGQIFLTEGLFHHGRPSKSLSPSHLGGSLVSPAPCSDSSAPPSSRLDEIKGVSSSCMSLSGSELPKAAFAVPCPCCIARRDEPVYMRSKPSSSASARKTSSFSISTVVESCTAVKSPLPATQRVKNGPWVRRLSLSRWRDGEGGECRLIHPASKIRARMFLQWNDEGEEDRLAQDILISVICLSSILPARNKTESRRHRRLFGQVWL